MPLSDRGLHKAWQAWEVICDNHFRGTAPLQVPLDLHGRGVECRLVLRVVARPEQQ